MKGSELVIDIGSGSIGSTVMRHEAGKILLESSQRVQIGTGSETSRAELAKRALEALKTTLAAYSANPHISGVHITLAAPWYDARIRSIISQASKRPAKINRQTVLKAVREYERANAVNEATLRAPIESVVTQVYVNGYPTALKSSVIGSSLRINVYESVADGELIASMQALVRSELPRTKVTFHTFPLASFMTLRSTRDETGFVLADIGAEITDVFVVDRDSLRFLASFPIGTASIARAMSQSGSVSEDTLSRLALFGKGELSLTEMSEFKIKFDAASSGWLAEFKKIQESVVSEAPFPQTVFVIADRAELDWLPILLDSSHFEIPLRALPITPDSHSEYILLGEGGMYDAFLTLESLYLNASKKELIEL